MTAEQRYESLSPERRALVALQQMRSELDELKRAWTEPIAVIGMACRFPGGADTPEAFWRLLAEARDAVTEVPRDRYDVDAFYDPDVELPGRIVAREGAFIDQIDQF